METIKMSEHKLAVSALEKDVADLKLSANTSKTALDGLKEENTKLSDTNKTLVADAEKSVKEATHKSLFDDGKINAAQLTALNEGKNMLEVLALTEKMNNKQEGNSGEGRTDISGLTTAELQFCEKYGHTPEEYVAANKGAK